MKSWQLLLLLLFPLLSACEQAAGCPFSERTQTAVSKSLKGLTNQQPYIGVSTKSHHGGSPKLSFSIGFDGAPDRVSVLEIQGAAQREIEKACHMEAPPMEISFAFVPSGDN